MEKGKPISFIFATGPRGEFGFQGKLPWKSIPEELKSFKKITMDVVYPTSQEDDMPPLLMNAVIMGRKTWESLPTSSRPLPGRFNIVLSSQEALPCGSTQEPFCVVSSIEHAIAAANENQQVQSIFVIGGVDLFRNIVKKFPMLCKEMIHTMIYGDFEADVFLHYENMVEFFSLFSEISHCSDDDGKLIFTTRRWMNPNFMDTLTAKIFKVISDAKTSKLHEGEEDIERTLLGALRPNAMLYRGTENVRMICDLEASADSSHTCCQQGIEAGCPPLPQETTSLPPLFSSSAIDDQINLDNEQRAKRLRSIGEVLPQTRDEYSRYVSHRQQTIMLEGVQTPRTSGDEFYVHWEIKPSGSLLSPAAFSNWKSLEDKINQICSTAEQQYLSIVRKIIYAGSMRIDRTRVGTSASFGERMVFSLRDATFPLLTTKRVPFQCVAKELLWFISGCTDSKVLSRSGVQIWNANGSRTFLDSLGFHDREVGDLGPIYGHQWRHFGAKYVDCRTDYTGQGFDQLADCIRKIKETPTDRRIVMSAWNPADLHMMVLPPCHMFCQFFVANGELSCLMYQRSGDMGLGVPFNIASYALLTIMVAHVCDLLPGDFHHIIGDAHVYSNHEGPLTEQLTRDVRPFPKLYIKRKITDIDQFKIEDFELEGYNPHPPISMEMAL